MVESILIILIAGIGDLVLASKGIRAIRNGYPHATIHLLTNTESLAIAENYPYIDRVWSFPVRELRHKKSLIIDILRVIKKLRKNRFNLLANFYRIYSWYGAFRMGLLFLALRAGLKIGHDNKGFGCFINRKVPGSFFENRHFAEGILSIAEYAGGIPDDKGIEVFCKKEVAKKWEATFSEPNILKIAINPGADNPVKRWAPERYARVAEQLIDNLNAMIFILGGPGEESLAGAIQDKMTNKATNLAGKLTLDDLVYLLSMFDLLITNDSGPMHMAAAVRTPIVAIFGPEDPVYTRPYTSENRYRIVTKDVDCRPCYKRICKEAKCLDLITVDEVYEKCIELIPKSS